MIFSTSSVAGVLAVLVAGLSLVSSLPLEERGYNGCKEPRIRKEWRSLSDYEKKDYLRAVDCLHSTPGQYDDIIDDLSIFEDYIYVHKIEAPYVHFVGHFLPWHRYFMWTYESDLRDRCGYRGAQPFWDYSLDVPPSTEVINLTASPIFSPQSGFGGNGGPGHDTPIPGFYLPEGTGGGCIYDGPFANWTIHIGKNTSLVRDDRCLMRSLNPTVAARWLGSNITAEIMVQENYGWMSHVLEGQPSYETMGVHGGGHFVIGGSDRDIYTSNAEPLFYLHHTNLDRIWWEWQTANPEDRLWDISGPIAPSSDILSPNRTNLSKENVTVDFEIQLGRLGGTITVGDTMDTMGGFLCYKYELDN